MSDNKQVALKFHKEIFQDHVFDNLDDYLHDKFVSHSIFDPITDKPFFIDFFKGFFSANPEFKSEVKRVIVDGDYVVLHNHNAFNSQHNGFVAVDIFRFRDGKIEEHWDIVQEIPETSKVSNVF